MNGRKKVITLVLFPLLSIIILLQILSIVQSDRFYESLNRRDEIFESSKAIEATSRLCIWSKMSSCRR